MNNKFFFSDSKQPSNDVLLIKGQRYYLLYTYLKKNSKLYLICGNNILVWKRDCRASPSNLWRGQVLHNNLSKQVILLIERRLSKIEQTNDYAFN